MPTWTRAAPVFTLAPWKGGTYWCLLGLLGRKHARMLSYFLQSQNSTSGHPNPKMDQAIRYYGNKQEKLILSNLSRKEIYWKEID